VQADEPYDEFEIDWTPVWPDEEGRLEPIFFDGPQWIEFPEPERLAAALEPALADAALPVEFEEFALLDPEAADEPEEPLPLAPRRASAASLAASFGVHLLTLFLLIGWHSAPAEIAGAIPVQLVIKEASAAPQEMQPGQSVAVRADQAPQAASAVTPAEPPPARPQTQVASIKPSDKPRPPTPRPRPSAPPSRPAPPARAAKPAPAPAPPPKTAAAEQRTAQTAPAPVPERPTAAAGAPSTASIAVRHEGAASGVATGEGDYFSRLEQLTRPYLYMLSPSFLAGRRGSTTLTIVVGDDGTVGRIGVKLSSGYPDIDTRIAQMVQAVGRFPPLPQQLRRPGADLDFNLVFPDVLAQ
jgi:TonB family protein